MSDDATYAISVTYKPGNTNDHPGLTESQMWDGTDAFLRDMAGWVAAGEVRYLEDIREGLEAVPGAFAEMLRGGNFGKMLVRIADDPTL